MNCNYKKFTIYFIVLITVLVYAGLTMKSIQIQAREKWTELSQVSSKTQEELKSEWNISNIKAVDVDSALPNKFSDDRIILDIYRATQTIKNFNSKTLNIGFSYDETNSFEKKVFISWTDTVEKSRQFVSEIIKSPAMYEVVQYYYTKDTEGNNNNLVLNAFGSQYGYFTRIHDDNGNANLLGRLLFFPTKISNAELFGEDIPKSYIKDFVLKISDEVAVFSQYKGYNSYLSGNDITLTLTQIGDKYYYSYTVDGQTYPPNGESEIILHNGQNFAIEVIDSSSNQTQKVNLKIINNTDRKVNVIGDTKNLISL